MVFKKLDRSEGFAKMRDLFGQIGEAIEQLKGALEIIPVISCGSFG